MTPLPEEPFDTTKAIHPLEPSRLKAKWDRLFSDASELMSRDKQDDFGRGLIMGKAIYLATYFTPSAEADKLLQRLNRIVFPLSLKGK